MVTTEPLEEAVSFGPKTAWLAFRGDLPARFCDLVGAVPIGPCSWQTGVNREGDGRPRTAGP